MFSTLLSVMGKKGAPRDSPCMRVVREFGRDILRRVSASKFSVVSMVAVSTYYLLAMQCFMPFKNYPIPLLYYTSLLYHK